MHRFIQGLVLAGALATAGCDVAAGVSPAAALVSGEQGITAIAADGTFVYWSTQKGAVKRISIDGGEPEILVAEGSGALGGTGNLQVDGQSLYWTTSEAVMAVSKSGGTPAILAGKDVPLSDLTGLTVDNDDFVYFTESAGFVRKAPKIAGEMVTLATGEESPISPVVRGGALFWVASSLRVLDVANQGDVPTSVQVTGGAGFGQISVDDSNVYWADSGIVNWVPRVGGDVASVTPAASADGTLAEIPVVLGADTDVYWSDVTGAISAATVIPNANASVVVTGPAGLVTLATDDVNLYWANSADGTVVEMPLSFANASASTAADMQTATPTY